jgi:hypothetical protein
MKEECLSKVILLDERSLRRALNEFFEYYHAEERAMSSCSLVIQTFTARASPRAMPRAIGWAPALLQSRGSIIARPRFNPGTLILRDVLVDLPNITSLEEARHLLASHDFTPFHRLGRPLRAIYSSTRESSSSLSNATPCRPMRISVSNGRTSALNRLRSMPR